MARWRRDGSLPPSLAADIEEAAAALKEFDGYARSLLGLTSPTLGPMSAVLLRTESASSSQIENLTVGARQLALAEIGQATSTNAKTVAANVRAMEAALGCDGPLGQQSILAMHQALLSGQPGWEDQAGRYRDQLVWVGASRLGPIGASHVAPQPELVPAAMADLIVFINRDDLPIGLQAPVAHAQFETIHPFVDGNGRTGRALIHAMLKNAGILVHTTAPISAGLLTDTKGYFAALASYRAGDARPIVERFADAARFAAITGRDLVDQLANQLTQARDKLAGVRPQSAAWSVLPHLIAHPVVSSAFLRQHLGLGEVTVNRALTVLTERGVLAETTGLKRNRVWQHVGILDVLNTYAEALSRQ